jgi:hypothetical protein
MQTVRKLRRQHRLDSAVPLQPAQAAKCCGNQKNVKVRFPLWPRAGMAAMAGAVVLDIQHERRESLGEESMDTFDARRHSSYIGNAECTPSACCQQPPATHIRMA